VPKLALVKAEAPPSRGGRKRQQRFMRGSRFVLLGPSRRLTRARFVDSFRVGRTRMLVLAMDQRGV
jgi:hypothetical protein